MKHYNVIKNDERNSLCTGVSFDDISGEMIMSQGLESGQFLLTHSTFDVYMVIRRRKL